MQNNLVIVESPAKARTIEKFLGSGYKVMSSYGHIRDLKKKSFSVDVEHGFAPIYEVPADKKKLVAQLKAEADRVRNSIKAKMEAREVEELIAGQYIIRWTSVLSNRFDSTAFKRVCPELYKAYTKQTASRRFTISV